ncbi:biorientation of chromosomes in cell division protein 1-like 1 isoform X2 [Malaclemys terrapin pileata]|uniref:biorientation of chromosomes in cell division protein 1-like 1 isoform X2 n=1 Tax=Malaclemys terrapin pileata TaxID=2991368 RepID=UPI0023A8FCE4|nr:biorientation of chromosomes in cell division protein 1-like 1 isoform X2 [Malaclemys terrapin pileata]
MASNPQPQPPPPPPPPPPPQQQPPLPGASGGGGAVEPELVSVIVNHLKSQGLFDQFRRDCLADVDTKPAYQNLRQRVDNFVSNHLATHTWSPHLNKNQLRNNIRQQVLKSGMLESGIDRIISQVVDPKINHTFRPQVEKAVHEFLATLNHKEEASPSTAPSEEKADASITVQGVSTAAPSANVASDAMSILETITSLNQEASAARASTENTNSKNSDRTSKRLSSQQSVDGSTERERNSEDLPDQEKPICDSSEGSEAVAKCEDLNELPCPSEEIKNSTKDVNNLIHPSKEILLESDDQKSKLTDKGDKKPESTEKGERKKEKKEKNDKKFDHSKKNDDALKAKEEKQVKEREAESVKQLAPEKSSSKHKITEGIKEEHILEDSDVDVLSDITVSSVHTSDLSSFEEESEEEAVVSDSTEEGEITSDDEEEKNNQSKTKPQTNEVCDGKAKPVRHAYVHKPFLYSKYYSDSDDERTVEQHRQSIAREKEERLVRRQINRERLEEKRKQKAAEKTKSLKSGSQSAEGKSGLNLEESSTKDFEMKVTGTSIKDVLKEQKFLEKKVALSRKRKRDSRHVEDSWQKKYEHPEEDSKETQKTNETCEKISSKELKHNHGKSEVTKPVRRVSESVHSTEESKNDPKVEREHKRKTSTSLQIEGTQQDTETRDPKKQLERAEISTDELQKQKYAFKNEKHLKKDDTEIQNLRSVPKKELKSFRDKNEKERTLSEDKLLVKHKYKGDSVHKINDDIDLHSFERSLKGEDSVQKHNQQTKVPSDDKSEKKSKHRSERKISTTSKDGKNVSEYTLKNEEMLRKENNKKDRHISTEKSRAEYKSKRSSSDSRPQKDSQGNSKQLVSSSQRRSESYLEDKHEIESTNSDSNLRQEDSIHRDRRRSKSFLEDKFLLKSKSKSHSKQSKPIETELQESCTKHETVQKPDKDKNMEENDTDKQRKSKNEDKVFDESIVDFEVESGMHSIYSLQKDFSHRVKLQAGEKVTVKEKNKSDKDLSYSKLERKLSVEGHKSRNLKHSNKEMKKKEESNKLEDKDIKEIDNNHEKVQGIMIMDKKSSKKLSCENKKGNLSAHEVTMEEEKLATDIFVTSHIPATQSPIRTSDGLLHSEQGEEPMEVDSEQTYAKVHEASKIEEKNSSNSLLDMDSENAAKENMNLHNSKNELRNRLADFEACVSEFPADRNSEQTIEHVKNPIEGVDALDTMSKQASEEQGPIKQGAYQMNIVYETSGRILLNAPIKEQTSEDARKPKNLNKVNPIRESLSLAINSSRQDASHKKSMDICISDFTDSLPNVAKEESHTLDKICLKKDSFILDNSASQTAYMEQQDSPVLGCVMKEAEVTMINTEKKDGETCLIGEQAVGETMGDVSIQEGYDQVTMLDSVQRRNVYNVTGGIEGKSLMADQAADHEGISMKKSVLMNLGKKESDNLNIGAAAKEEKGSMVDIVEKSEGHDMGDVVESSLLLVPMNVIRVPEEIIKDSFIVSGAEESDGIITDTENKNESNVVGTSAGSVDHIYNRLETTEATAIGTSTEKMIESTVMATSTGEGKGEGAAIHSEKESDATTTCSEEESEVTLICTSIEADEGFTTSIWTKSNEGVSFSTEADGECTVAAAEEGSGVVTGGFAETESFLTSTKEGESAECTMIYTEENDKDSVNAGRIEIEDNVNSAGTEEKDDAVTSAGSEEKCKTSTCRRTGKFEISVTCIGEIESDGAVTSAGTEAGEGSMSSNNSNECQSNVTGADQLKESEGAVTCTGAEERGHGFIIGSVTGVDAQEDSAVTGACVEMVMNNNTMSGTSADKGEDIVNGESAVTSTGIIAEDDAETAAVCTGLEDSNESFAVGLDVEKCESAMDSTGAKEKATITMISIGPCDDEGFVTSTGAKEEDEEGEGIVTSTGRGNEEIEHASTCAGIEGESALICIASEEGESSIICIVAEQVEAESGMAATNINKDGVDSNTGAKKEANGGIICKSAKGIVESSVTSASIANEDTLTPNTEEEDAMMSIDVEAYEGPMTSVVTEKDKGQSAAAAEEKNGNSANGSHGRKCEGPITSAVTKKEESPPASTDEEKAKGDVISTSIVEEGDAPMPCSATEIEEGSLTVARTDENESTVVLIDKEEFEAPRPSTATEFKETTYTASSKQAKDECTMISTSIVEEFEAPMPSVAMEYNSQVTAARKEVNESTMFCIDMEIYEVAMPSASSARDDGNHPTASSKEEKDECAMISTSIMEEQVILVSSEATEDRIQHVAAGTEAKSDTAMISTSMEYFEAPVPSAAAQDEDQLTASGTEGRLEAAMITRSGTEECEIVLISAATQAESQLIAAETEEKDESSMITPDAAEECKVVETSAARDEQHELTALNTEGKSGGSMIIVRKVVECGTPMLRVASSNEDQHIASSIEDKEEGAVITLSTMEECDSLFTFSVIEENQLVAANTEVKDENVIFNSTKEIECILSSTGPEKSDSSLPVGGREGDECICRGEKEIHEDAVMGESVVAKITSDTEVAETAETTVNLISVDEALCMEISTESTVIVSPSAEMGASGERAEEYIPYVEFTSEPCIPSEEAKRNDNFKNIDYNVNSSCLLENDFSEARTSPPRAQTLPLVSEHESKLAVNTNQGEITVEAKLGEKSDFPVSHMDKQFENDGKKNTVEVDDNLGIEVSFQQNTSFNSGKKETLPILAEELELKTNLKTEEPQKSRSPTREELHEEPHIEECLKDLPLKNASLKKDPKDVENSDTQRVEECSCKERKSKSPVTTGKETAQETSNTIDMTEAANIQIEVKDQEIEIPDQEKVSSMPGMGKKQSPTREDDYPITQDLRKGNKQSQCSKIKDIKDVASGDIAEVSKEIIRKHAPLSSAVEEKDELTSKQDTCEKAKQSLECNLSSVEENQPVIVKRKRGRPRKYPLEAVQSRMDSEADINTGNVQQSPTLATRGKFSQTAKDTSNKKETANEGEAGKAEMIVRRRGRKPRCSVIPSEETEILEPERKRRKLASAAEEEMKEQEEEDDEDDDDDEDDETHSGATTRSATRLEAQKKQPSKPTTRAASKGNSPSPVSPKKQQNSAAKKRSPSEAKVSKSPPLAQLKIQTSKRKREASPPAVRRKGQLKVDETPLKKTKR